MLRKIFSTLILVIFLTNSTNFAFAELSFGGNSNLDIKTQISDSKSKIKNMKNGSRYILQLNKINQFINKQSDLLLLEKIKSKLEEKKGLVIGKDELTYELLNYIGLVVEKRIGELEDIEGANIIKLIENSTLSQEETKKVEDEIVKLQINLLDSSKTLIDKLLSDLKKSVNVEKTGNLKLNVEGSGAMFGSAKGELSVKDMKSKSANFDSELEAQVDLLVEASVIGGQELKTQFSSFVSFINKDGNMYLLLQKLNYSGLESIDFSGQATSILNKLKELGNNNQYLKIEDKQSAMVLNMIKNFDLNSIYGEANKVLQKPMLKPYKKDGDKYLLAPTKDFCDTVKYLSYKINGYGSYSCSDEEYKKMLRESVIGGNLYIIVDGNDKHFGFEESKKYGEVGFIKIYFSDKKIEKLLIKSEATTGKYKGQNVELTYINGQKFDFIVLGNDDRGSINFSFKSGLASDNKFKKINYIFNYFDGKQGFNSSFNLENKKFKGEFISIGHKDINLSGIIAGELNSTNDLSALDFNIKSLYIPTKNIFDLNYSLKNEIITGTISYKENNKELFSVKSNGKYKKEYFELNNVINVIDSNSLGNINGNLNTKFTGNSENNNFDLYIDVYSNMGYIKINLTTDSKVEYKDDIKIEAPTNYKTIEDLMGGANEFFNK
ncbi:MAG: hypothetical protein WC850_03210 [Candidatus Gracilibacteria bacterium]